MSREVVLSRIRAALHGKKSKALSASEPYRRAGVLGATAGLHLLEDRLREYDARVFRCSGESCTVSVKSSGSAG